MKGQHVDFSGRVALVTDAGSPQGIGFRHGWRNRRKDPHISSARLSSSTAAQLHSR